MKTMIGYSGVLIAAFTFLSGCGSIDTRATVEQLTNARVAVEAADKMGAQDHAPQELRRAQDALAIAQDAYANETYERAFDFAKKATIYGLVAKARTEQKTAEKKLALLKKQLEEVKAKTDSYMKSSPLTTPAPQITTTPGAAEPKPQANPTKQEGVKP